MDPLEMLEVQLCNVTAPFLLVSRLRGAMKRSTARRKYIVNVSAMEGQFSRAYKGPGHPHTNMAKAALNMMTRTSAQEMLDSDGILMTAVDTGWITDERPHFTKVRLMEEGFHAPLDLVDGAARVYDPIVMGETARTSTACSSRTTSPAPGRRRPAAARPRPGRPARGSRRRCAAPSASRAAGPAHGRRARDAWLDVQVRHRTDDPNGAPR